MIYVSPVPSWTLPLRASPAPRFRPRLPSHSPRKLTLLAPTGWGHASPDCLARLSNPLGAENVKLTGV